MIALFPELSAAAAALDVERLAVLVRRYFGGSEMFSPRPGVRPLAQSAGLDVETLPLNVHGALLAKDERGAFKIVAVVAPGLAPAAERFLLAHLLGHYFLDIAPKIAGAELVTSGYREVADPMHRYATVAPASVPDPAQGRDALIEDRADRFAAALLMPKAMVRRALAKLEDVERAAAFFGVPRGVLTRRVADAGLAAARPGSFLEAERELGAPPARVALEESAALRPGAVVARETSAPRAVAAGSYDQMARTTGATVPAEPAAAPTASASAARESGRGMERLRALARKLDKSV
jgi:hypothetical protein